MKKITILIVSFFFLSGCYDYSEIDKMAFVSAIGLDYKNDEFITTLEILNDKADKDSQNITTYTTEGHDKSLAKSIEKASSKVSDQINYTHTKLMIVSKNILNNKMEKITDYFLRSTNFRENFYIVSSLDNDPKDIFDETSKKNPVASNIIIDLLENNNYASNSAILKTFDEVSNEILTFGIDTCFTNIKLSEKNFIIDGIVIFNDYKYVDKLNNEEASIYNILNDNFFRPIFSKKYNDDYFAISVVTGKANTELKNGTININGNLTGKIMDNEISIDIQELKNIEKINNDFSNLLNEKFEKFIKKLQENNSDILGISKKYYQKTRIKNDKSWKFVKINANTKLKINKKGLIYEVPNEK